MKIGAELVRNKKKIDESWQFFERVGDSTINVEQDFPLHKWEVKQFGNY